jgi:hypothetical protein
VVRDHAVAGVLDWESVAIGSRLWDIGSLFRYERRYSATFRQRFAAGCSATGASLPNDWWIWARVLDATRVVGILSEDRDMPSVFDECRSILSSLI